MKEEKEIQRTRALNSLSYRDAVKAVKTKVNTKSPSITTATPEAISNQPQANKKTNNNTDINNKGGIPPNFSMEKLALCILDIFSTLQRADNLPKKCTLVANAFSTHLGIEIDRNMLANQVKSHTSKPTPWPNQSPIIQTKSTHLIRNGRKV